MMSPEGGPVPRARFLFFHQVWLYHGGTPLRELLQPHGFRERAPPLENLEHDELNRSDNDDPAERREIQL